jgi:DNA-binding transcriptional LysR family regulator
MVDFRSLELFFWVAQLNSFSKAAERMNTTQPAVSQRIAALEAEFGARIFDRSARSIMLTQKGQVLFEYAERFLRLRTEMLAEMAAPAAMTGTLRLGVSESIARTWLGRFLERAHAIYPNVVIDLTIDVSPTMRSLLISGELDLAFLLGPLDDPHISNHPLCSLPLEFIASPNLDLGAEEPLSVEAIRRFPIITYPKTTSPYPLLRELLSNPSGPPPRIFGNTSLTTMCQMAIDRIGLCVIPPAVVAKEIADGQLRVIKTVVKLPPHVFTASYPMALAGGLAAPLAELAQKLASDAQL